MNVVDFFFVVGIEGPVYPIGERGTVLDTPFALTSLEDLNTQSFAARVLSRYPEGDHNGSSLPDNAWMFCLPSGVTLSPGRRPPTFHIFVLTELSGEHMYGACITFDEVYTPTAGQPDLGQPIFSPKSICLVSHWGFYSLFRDFLSEIFRLYLECEDLPLEKYVQMLLYDVPLPPPGKVSVAFDVGNLSLEFSRPPLNDLPLADFDFEIIFRCFDAEKVVLLFSAVLCERQILFVSSQNSLLTLCAETLRAIMFPLRWEHVYIPILPFMLSNFIFAPMPYIMGIQPAWMPEDPLPDEVIVAYVDENRLEVRQDIPKAPEPYVKKLLKRMDACLGPNRRLPGSKLDHELIIADAALPPTYTPSNLSRDTERQAPPRSTLQERLTGERSAGVPAPWESSLLLHSVDFIKSEAKRSLTVSRSIRVAFLRFMVSLLVSYESFLNTTEVPHRRSSSGGGSGGTSGGDDPSGSGGIDTMDVQGFLKANSLSAEFLEHIVGTMGFVMFIEGRCKPASLGIDFEALFFDSSIAAKVNKSVFTLRKTLTPFLDDRSFSVHEVYVCPKAEPDSSPTSRPGVFPKFDPSKARSTPSLPSTLCRDVTEILRNYGTRIVNDTNYSRVRLDEQKAEEKQIDWTVFDEYDNNVPRHPNPTYHLRSVSRSAASEGPVNWLKVVGPDKQVYFYNLHTLLCSLEPPTFAVGATEYQYELDYMKAIRSRQMQERTQLFERHSKAIDELGENIAEDLNETLEDQRLDLEALLDRHRDQLLCARAVLSDRRLHALQTCLDMEDRASKENEMKALERARALETANQRRKQEQVAALSQFTVGRASGTGLVTSTADSRRHSGVPNRRSVVPTDASKRLSLRRASVKQPEEMFVIGTPQSVGTASSSSPLGQMSASVSSDGGFLSVPQSL